MVNNGRDGGVERVILVDKYCAANQAVLADLVETVQQIRKCCQKLGCRKRRNGELECIEPGWIIHVAGVGNNWLDSGLSSN